ncbi:hypothetical protein [Anaerococcus vaginalis]|jgi:hypothetical protein|uniref:hypothetical protein n=1 Tax=Anaerococcus vaginalis TaxID=33037 RepID=UPI002908E891|nr:hypothetical protein [Anaerococcus vaginalis]MDU5253046.1 hypothetical protein [Anaerococcus vaginalis]MDU6781631.1 hypothetical protein [Anaerococcus vaginalis]
MIKGKTKSGFRYSIDENIITDFEFIENLEKVMDNGAGLSKVLIILLGEKQKKALINYVRDKKTKRVPVKNLIKEVEDILSNPKIKNL